MIFSSVGYCVCGEQIWLEYLQKDGAWQPRFFSEDHREITHCPSCGRELDEDELDSL
jgi:hypothetical protein